MEKIEIYDTKLIIEGKGKITTIFNIIEYPKALKRHLEVIYPDNRDYDKAIELMTKLLKKGTPIPTIDLLIASICINHGFILRTKDKHFEKISEIEPKFKLVIE